MVSDFDIVTYIKKNRNFSKTKKISMEKDIFFYIVEKLNELSNINYIIFQDKIYEDHLERFLYTDDTYVFILNNLNCIDKIKNIDYNNYIFKSVLLLLNNEVEYLKR